MRALTREQVRARAYDLASEAIEDDDGEERPFLAGYLCAAIEDAFARFAAPVAVAEALSVGGPQGAAGAPGARPRPLEGEGRGTPTA